MEMLTYACCVQLRFYLANFLFRRNDLFLKIILKSKLRSTNTAAQYIAHSRRMFTPGLIQYKKKFVKDLHLIKAAIPLKDENS